MVVVTRVVRNGPPANVIGVNVCRVSGKLPNQGCGSVPVVHDDGNVENRSMIYTEYFVRGTQPTTTCPLHEAPGFMDRLAGVFGKDSGNPVPAGEVGSRLPPPTSTSGASATPAAPEPKPEQKVETEEPKKKRGFWSRIFGRGDDDKNKEEERKKEEQRKKEEERKKKPPIKPGG